MHKDDEDTTLLEAPGGRDSEPGAERLRASEAGPMAEQGRVAPPEVSQDGSSSRPVPVRHYVKGRETPFAENRGLAPEAPLTIA